MNSLTPEEAQIILYKGTEEPYSGEYYNYDIKGTYHCRQCNAPLFSSEAKLKSDCGWPSFDNDDEFGNVQRVTDRDGRRTEIICMKCHGHLGHVFEGEQLTEKNTRHCVNSLSMKFREA
jgi:methionine-R-sulfoxide reductase